MINYKISEPDAQRLAMEWTLRRLGHDLNYYSTADALLVDVLPKYNEAMNAIAKYNHSVDSETG